MLTAKLNLPEGHTIVAFDFFGDNGKSSLSSGNDGGTGKDGPYEIAFLCESSEMQVPELWFVPLDGIGWHVAPQDLLQGFVVDSRCSYNVVANSSIEDESPRQTIISKSKSPNVGKSKSELFLTILAPWLIPAAMSLPKVPSADGYMLHFSATRGTAMITSVRSDEGTIAHTVLDVAKKDDEEDEEEEDVVDCQDEYDDQDMASDESSL